MIISNICNVDDRILPVVYVQVMYNTPGLESALCGVKQSISLTKYAEYLGYSVSHSKDARWDARADQEHEQHEGRARGGMGRQFG